MGARTTRRLLASAGLALAVATTVAAVARAGALDTVRARAVDILFQLRSPERARVTLVVGVDQRTHRELLPRFGTMVTWPRTLYAQALDRLRPAAPRVVFFDMFFDVAKPEDAGLAAAMRRDGNVVMPVEARGPLALRPAPGVAQEFAAFVRSAPGLHDAGVAEGVVNVTIDPDSVVRSLPPLLRAGGRDIPAAPLVAAARFVRRPRVLDEPPERSVLYAAGRAIPLFGNEQLRINYLGPASSPERGGPLPMISFVDVLEGRFDPGLVRDRVVLIGLTIPGVDEHATPTTSETRMWGVEILAHAVETIVDDRYLESVPPTVLAVLILGAALLAALLAALSRPLRALAALLALLAIYLSATVILFERGLLLDPVLPPAALGLAFAATLVYRIVFEQAEQRRVRAVMARYLSPSVSRWVLEDPSRLNLGGELREMTVLFSDVRGFTPLAGALDPRTLVALLNEHMSAMAGVIFRHDGVLDKFIGDAIMAFWNAPQDQPDHARRACAAALDMVEALRALHTDWQRRRLPRLELGIGINTGAMVVGNMGSRERLAYTVMGDTVNVASRVESLSKLYGARIVTGEPTRAAAGDGFVFRFLDVVAVKGRSDPLAVHELLGRRGEVGGDLTALLEEYERGVCLYRGRRWAEAARLFAGLHARAPADGPIATYDRRSRTFVERPPGDDWDGVFVAETK